MAKIDLKFMKGDRTLAKAMGSTYVKNPRKKAKPKKETKK